MPQRVRALQQQSAAVRPQEQLAATLRTIAARVSRAEFLTAFERRLGALLRLSGVEWKLVREFAEPDGPRESALVDITAPLEFRDSDGEFHWRFSFNGLSYSARNAVIDTSLTILDDYLRTLDQHLGRSGGRAEWRQTSAGKVAVERIHPAHPMPGLGSGNGGDSDVESDNSKSTYEEVARLDQSYASLTTRLVHKLRNSLTAILSCSSQLLESADGVLPVGDLSLLQLLAEAGESQKVLLDRFLLLAGPVKVSLRRLELGAYLHSLLRQYNFVTGRIASPGEVQPELSLITDAELLRQIVTELLDNAFEAGGAEQRVSLRYRRDDNTAMIIVRNAGEASITDFRDHFLQPFYSTKPGHCGVGLPIADRYARLIGGRLRALSLRGQTAIVLQLPLPVDD